MGLAFIILTPLTFSILRPNAVNTGGIKRFPPYVRKVATSTLKYWVLNGGWRDARYVNEPAQHRMENNLIYLFCEALERIAWARSY